MSMDLLRVAPLHRADVDFVYGMLRFSAFPDQVKQYANGANVLHLSPDRIGEYEVLLPSAEARQRYSGLVAPLTELADTLHLQNENLRSTRDVLLPRLLSGQIDVSELEIDTEWLAS
jgi:type I restriction enzyme S subunit